jgi:hypothetical protein
MTMMTEFSNSVRMRAHRANIERYRKLLAGRLARVEREYIMRRIAEERAGLRRLESCLDEGGGGRLLTDGQLAGCQKRPAASGREQRP